LENTADLSVRVKQKTGFTVANRLEYARFGDEDIMSAGFLFLEFQRSTKNKRLALEPYALMLWQEIRSLEVKYAGGANLRHSISVKKNFGFFAGAGLFYEYERWNLQGVPDDSRPQEVDIPIELKRIRAATYLSLNTVTDLFTFDMSIYFQPNLEALGDYRLASSTKLKYRITQHIGLAFIYQNIYDPEPVVPIDEVFHDITVGLELSF